MSRFSLSEKLRVFTMRRLSRAFLIIALFFCLVNFGLADSFYVSKSGNDSWDGTQPAWVSGTIGPKLTLGAVDGTFLQAGDTLEIRVGAYQEASGVTWPTQG